METFTKLMMGSGVLSLVGMIKLALVLSEQYHRSRFLIYVDVHREVQRLETIAIWGTVFLVGLSLLGLALWLGEVG
ncbi:MAG: hypothetical protein EOP83_08105 [Verrucomicrobiaceae bacterium]|nr:MAG: hypothetical protein EOP83_08105 [Verrucomicrobiaceae bacterium]